MKGLIGVVDGRLEQITYKKAVGQTQPATFKGKSGWLGITDKYWAAALVPEQGKDFEAHFTGTPGAAGAEHFQSDYLMSAVVGPRRRQGRDQGLRCLPAPRRSISSTATPPNTRSPNSTC